MSDQLLLEIQTVTKRPKLEKYFSEQKIKELLQFLLIVAEKHEPVNSNQLSRDPKDNFLLDLIEVSKADFLISGDKDLLVLNPFKVRRYYL